MFSYLEDPPGPLILTEVVELSFINLSRTCAHTQQMDVAKAMYDIIWPTWILCETKIDLDLLEVCGGK